MGRKLKAVLLLPSRTYGCVPDEYVPASVAQGLLDALEEMTNLYVSLVDGGDCGFWDAEKDDEVKHARAAIAAATGEE